MDSLVSVQSLQEHLMQQVEVSDVSPETTKALEHLIGSIDERGFLTQSPSDAALQTGLPLSNIQEAVHVLHGFDPPGIGSESLEECLLTQLSFLDRGNSLAARIVRDHFALLSRRRIPELAKMLLDHFLMHRIGDFDLCN